MKQKVLLPVGFMLLLVLLGVSACALDNISAPAATATPPHWTYEGEEGPTHWGELPGYELCGRGESQSPIDIAAPGGQDLTNIAFHYQPSDVKIMNNGHTVQVTYDAGSYIELDGIRYDVAQFHYHAPSEHEVDGKPFAAEIHIVHKNPAGQNALVVSLLLQEGTANAALDPFINSLPAAKSGEIDANIQINAMDFLPGSQTTYRYSGSLTTPPCTQGISWLVMTTPVEASSAQLSQLATVFEGNNRPVQPLNNRALLEDNTP